MYLLAGLGNPGAKYTGNRHNVGFMAVDAIQSKFDFGPFRVKFEGDVSEGLINSNKVLLLKPRTFMNDSGKSVRDAANFYKIPPAKIVVFHDELDLAPGRIRAKTGGGVAGHNGLKNIAQHLGQDFRRVRIGIGHPGDKDRVTGYVLADFSRLDMDWLGSTIAAIAEASPFLLQGADTQFMTKLASILNPADKIKDLSHSQSNDPEDNS